MVTSHDGAQRHGLLSRLVDYRGPAQVRRILGLTDEELEALLGGGPWEEDIWQQFLVAYEPYADLDAPTVMDEVSAGAGGAGECIGEDDDRNIEPPEGVAPGEVEPAEAAAPTVADRTRERRCAHLLKARMVMLAALYAEHLRPHEKLAVFRALLPVEIALMMLFGETPPILGEAWDADRRQSEIERRQRLVLHASGAQKRLHSGLRGWVNSCLGRGRIDRTDLVNILADIEQSQALFMGMNSDLRVVTGDYLRWDWYRN